SASRRSSAVRGTSAEDLGSSFSHAISQIESSSVLSTADIVMFHSSSSLAGNVKLYWGFSLVAFRPIAPHSFPSPSSVSWPFLGGALSPSAASAPAARVPPTAARLVESNRRREMFDDMRHSFICCQIIREESPVPWGLPMLITAFSQKGALSTIATTFRTGRNRGRARPQTQTQFVTSTFRVAELWARRGQKYARSPSALFPHRTRRH